MSKHIIDDAKRCLQCKKPMCSVGCPVRTPIRDAISLLLDSKIAQAGQLLFDNNPLSLVCCHVCPQENQCEGHCVLGRSGSPVQISAIEKYISDYYLNIHKAHTSLRNKGRIAIIGSGPAGITIAFILSARDYDVTIFERHDRIGGVLRYGIPEFRLPKKVLDRLAEKLIESGVRIRPNAAIGENLTIDDLLRDGYHAIFMGTGVWRPYRLGIPGESLGNVHYAIEYLRNPDVYHLGRRVAVIGAGNVAMDVARTAFRHGSEDVAIVCNLDESGITARPVEAEYARIDGTRFLLKKTIVRFEDNGVVLADSRLEKTDDGRTVATPVSGTESLLEVDSVIVAVGQGPRSVIVSSTSGIQVNERGLVTVDDSGHTTRDGIFASGDVVTGAKTVVEAVNISRRVADAMDRYVRERCADVP